MATKQNTSFKTGQRVTAVIWGIAKTGTVKAAHAQSSVVWVQWDGAKVDSWHHPESLKVQS